MSESRGTSVCLCFPVVLLLVLKSKLTFVNRTCFYINGFLAVHSLIDYFLSESGLGSFSGQVLALSH